MWFVKAWNWVKENAFAVGAAVGAAAVAILAFLTRKDVDETLIEIKTRSNKDQAETAEKEIKRVEEFVNITEQIKKEKERRGEELTKREEEKLEERKELYAKAETKEEMEKIAEDIKSVYPNLNFVPLESLVEINSEDD